MTRILIVDNHVGFVETLSRTLKDLGHEPIGVHGGMEAIKAVINDQPDLILLDYMMPELNGVETIFRIRSQPEGKTIPIVIISAISERTLEKRALAAGGNKFLKKPVDTKIIETLLKEFLE